MTSLWCHHAAFPGHWVPGNGFAQVLPHAFHNMTDLASLIAAAVPAGGIRRLGIIVHGDEGELKTGATGTNLVTPERVRSDSALRASLTSIARYLHANATIGFYSCSAAASERGSRLLTALSDIWPGRTVIGAITKGYRYGTLTAADLRDTLLTVIQSVPDVDQYFVPGQSTAPERNQFYLPATLPRFLTLDATIKKARSGAITHMPSGPGAFRQFELCYPGETRSMILAHPGQMIAGSRPGLSGGVQWQPAESDRQFYTRFLINIDWPPNFGRNALAQAQRAFPGW